MKLNPLRFHGPRILGHKSVVLPAWRLSRTATPTLHAVKCNASIFLIPADTIESNNNNHALCFAESLRYSLPYKNRSFLFKIQVLVSVQAVYLPLCLLLLYCRLSSKVFCTCFKRAAVCQLRISEDLLNEYAAPIEGCEPIARLVGCLGNLPQEIGGADHGQAFMLDGVHVVTLLI